MKAVILAAGKGTRMKDLTIERPKPMLFVKGKPILQYIIEGLLNVGINQIFIVTGHKSEVIEDYFKDGSQFGVQISYGKQVVQDGTGRAPLVARQFVGNDNFLLTYGDILVKPENYLEILNRFNPEQNDGVITVTNLKIIQKAVYYFLMINFSYGTLLKSRTKSRLRN
jgi:NDP-sugar pyrophosphorylase family protein